MDDNFLTLTNIEVRRSGRTILHIDNLRIKKGEFVGVIGTNGAGKTTLLQVCCGLIKPDKGTVIIDNQQLSESSNWQKTIIRKKIGYIPQTTEYNSDLPFTLKEVVAMGRTSIKPLLSSFNKEDHNSIDLWIDRVGLNKQKNQLFRSLSGGEQQKALIARAMVQNPSILMLDEPCSNLDFNWKYQISDKLNELHKRHQLTILMVSHETNLLPQACSRIILLDNGVIIADGTSEEIFTSGVIEKTYQCHIKTFDIDGQKYMYAVKNRP